MEISKVNQVVPVTYSSNTVVDNSNTQGQAIPIIGQNVDTSASQNSSQNNSQSFSKPNDNAPTEKELRKAVDRLNKFVEFDDIKIQYEVHPIFKDIMIKIVDGKTGNVLTEVPPKKILDLVAKMCEVAGIIFDKKA